MKKILISIFISITGGGLFAQTDIPEMITDRPDMTESAFTVNKGLLQTELGTYWETFEDKQISTTYFSHISALFRYGISENTEIRFGAEHLATRVQVPVKNTENNGFAPAMLGLKTVLLDAEEAPVQMALLAHVVINKLASEPFESTGLSPELFLAVERGLSDRLSLGMNIGAAWDDAQPYPLGFFSVALGFDAGEKTGLFIEYFQEFRKQDHPSPKIDGGITWSLLPNLQLDASGGYFLYGEMGYFLSFGVSFRYPK